MGFTINSFVADSNDDIISVDWLYTNEQGSIGNTHILLTPAGDFSLQEVTQATLVGWIEDQLENTTAEFDVAIAGDASRAVYAASLSTYTRESDNTYSI